MNTFTPSKRLINYKFDGYKLETIAQENAVSRFSLQFTPTQATVTGGTPLSFQEVQSRITHNHLAVESDSGRAIYVDSSYRIILVDLNKDMLAPSFRILHELLAPVRSEATPVVNKEYPSAAFISPTLAVVADGNGYLYIFTIRENGGSEPIGVYTLPLGSTSAPFRIHTVHRTSPTSAVAILSSRFYGESADKAIRGMKHQPTDFDIWAVNINLLSLQPSTEPRHVDVLWHRRGQDVPIFATYVDSLRSHLLIGGSTYPDPNVSTLKAYEPSADEIAPIPRPNENLDVPRPLPFSWNQTPNSVTIAFPLPSETLKSQIHVSFSSNALTLSTDITTSTAAPPPSYLNKPLWDGILSSSSYWTWDREAEHTCGLLTLYLTKRNEGTRWMQVFASSATTGIEVPEVPETLDPSELWHIRESLEKYTAALQTGEDVSGLGLGQGVPSLASGEMDEDVDAYVGRQAYLTWVTGDGSTPPWTDAEDVPFQLLSTPLPGKINGSSGISLIVKNDLDGIVYTLDTQQQQQDATPVPRWVHASTYSALAFVLASKQDTRFTHHIPSTAVLAFESGVRDRGGNVYIYRSASVKENWAKQAILKVDDGRGGALLGVGALAHADGRSIVVCLTEGELVLITGV